MDDNHRQFRHLLLHHLMAKPPPEQSPTPIAQSGQKPKRKRAYKTAGEIVEVEGGHIIRSTGRKDRHSKVCTAKGPRDRRVRLSANTAIQFYDVQDRLGYDRPSKAVDWLLKKAQSSIDELDELPPWKPTNTKIVANEEGEDERRSLLSTPVDSDSNPVQFQSCESQDLKLSLQNHQSCFPGFYSAGWEVQNSQPAELGRFQRLLGWNLASGSGNGNGNGFMIIPPQQQQQLQPLAAATHFFSQRGTLQSNNNATLVAATTSHDHHPVSFSGFGFGGGFSSFHIPARIQGDGVRMLVSLLNESSSYEPGSGGQVSSGAFIVNFALLVN